LTPELTKRVTDLIRAGNYADTACAASGVASSTFFNWLDRGRKAKQVLTDGGEIGELDTLCVDFLEQVENARAEAEIRNVAVVLRAGQETWQAAAWWLERTKPDRYGRKTRVEHSGDAEHPVVSTRHVEHELVVTDETRSRANAVLAALDESGAIVIPEDGD
jgi:hypothetical protein